jgi:hypothetical protein
VKAHDARRYVVWRKSVQALEKAIAGRLLFPLKDGEVIGIQEHRHNRSPFEFALANESPEADDFGKGLILGKDVHNLPVPRFALPGAHGGLEFGEFLLDPLQSGFQFTGISGHEVIVPSGPFPGKGDPSAEATQAPVLCGRNYVHTAPV